MNHLVSATWRSHPVIYQVEPGYGLHWHDRRFQMKNLKTNALKELPLPNPAWPGVPVPNPDAWVVNTFWQAPDVVDLFEATFVVPAEPSTKATQQIFLWPGLEAFGAEFSGLLQPVLAWGPWHAGGGRYWSVSSWYFQHPAMLWNPREPNFNVAFASTPVGFQTPAVQVNVGDTLTAVMRRTQETETASGYFDHQCEFFKVPDPTIPSRRIAIPGTALHLSQLLLRLNACYVTLEVGEGVTDCNHYPNTTKMTMTNITIQSLGTNQTVKWQEFNPSSSGVSLACGEQAKAVINNAAITEVDLHFRKS